MRLISTTTIQADFEESLNDLHPPKTKQPEQ